MKFDDRLSKVWGYWLSRLSGRWAKLVVLLAFTLGLVMLFGLGGGAMAQSNPPAQIQCDGRSMTVPELAAHRGLTLTELGLLQINRGLTLEEICRFPDAKLQQSLRKANNPKPDQPDEAMRFRLQQQEDENGNIPADGLINAVAHVQQMERGIAPHQQQQSVPYGAGIYNSIWLPLGPGQVGGRVRSFLIHPNFPERMWLGSVSGGIWHTSNGGQSWAPVNDFMANLAVSTMVMHPTKPDIMYAGTGEGFYNYGGVRGKGIFKSGNGGATWDQLSDTAKNDNFLYVNRLAIHPKKGDVLLAATGDGLFRSDNGGVAWTWVYSYPLTPSPKYPDKYYDVLDVKFDPNPSASGQAVAGSWNGNVFYSVDEGKAGTWRLAALRPPVTSGRVELAYAPSRPNTVYALVDNNHGEIYRSDDGGKTYNKVSTFTCYNIDAYLDGKALPNNICPLGIQGWYDNVIWVDPSNHRHLIIGGIDLWRSVNGGQTISKISEWQSNTSIHADHHFIMAHPQFGLGGNRTVFFANDGGIYRTSNIDTVTAKSGWQPLNNGLAITQFYGAAGHPNTGQIIAGAQDNGTWLFSPFPTSTWRSVWDGDGGQTAIDPGGYAYGEYTNGKVFRQALSPGSPVEYIYGIYCDISNTTCWNKSPPYAITDAQVVTKANFIAPLSLDPNDPTRLYVGGLSLWRTDDATAKQDMYNPGSSIWNPNTGPEWREVKTPISLTPAVKTHAISAIAVSPHNSNIVWVGHNNGNIYGTTTGLQLNPSWSSIEVEHGANNKLPNRIITRLVIDPQDDQIVYAAFGGYTAPNLWRTRNGGVDWEPLTGTYTISTTLPLAPIKDLEIHPTNSDWLYVATEVGLFTSENGGETWYVVNDGPANVSVEELFWLNDDLIAVTHGRGLFRAPAVGKCQPVWQDYFIPGSGSFWSAGTNLFGENPVSTANRGWYQVNDSSWDGWVVADTDRVGQPADYWLQTPPIPIAEKRNYVLSFIHGYDTEKNRDGGIVEIKINNNPWQIVGSGEFLSKRRAYDETGVNNPRLGGQSAFTGKNPDYPYDSESIIKLPALNPNDQLHIRFRYISDGRNQLDDGGWWIGRTVLISCPYK